MLGESAAPCFPPHCPGGWGGEALLQSIHRTHAVPGSRNTVPSNPAFRSHPEGRRHRAASLNDPISSLSFLIHFSLNSP